MERQIYPYIIRQLICSKIYIIGIRAAQNFLTLTKLVKNVFNIYISK